MEDRGVYICVGSTPNGLIIDQAQTNLMIERK